MNELFKSCWYTLFFVVLMIQFGTCQNSSINLEHHDTFMIKVQFSKNGFSLKQSAHLMPFHFSGNLWNVTQPDLKSQPSIQIERSTWKANKWQDIRKIYNSEHRIYNELIINRKRVNLAQINFDCQITKSRAS